MSIARTATALGAAAALSLVTTAPISAQAPPGADSVWAEIVTEWEELMDQGVVGGSLGLVHAGELVELETKGMANLGEGRPVDRSTIYHWASITKTFTGISIMQLRDRGLIDLDDPIVEYVPELRAVHYPGGDIEEVTIRHLLSHSAGFRASTWPWGGQEDWHPHEPTEWSQLVAMMPYTEITFEPGSQFSYSNPGIIFLGRVIEVVTGDVFEAYVDKNIFRPLGMRRSYFDTTPWGLLPHRSNHYFVTEGRPVPGGVDFNTGITVSNGGLNAPLDDMARYMAFLMGTRIEGSDYDAVLQRGSLTEMWRTEVPTADGAMGSGSMGLTYFLYDQDDVRIVGHTGSQRAFLSFFYLDADAEIAVLAAWNTVSTDGSGPDSAGFRTQVSERVVNELFPLYRLSGGGGS